MEFDPDPEITWSAVPSVSRLPADRPAKPSICGSSTNSPGARRRCDRSCGGACEQCHEEERKWNEELEAKGIVGPWGPEL